MKKQIVLLVALFALVQYRMDLLALLPGGPSYDPQIHGEVVLLSTERCRFCKSEREYLAEHDVPFVEYDVSSQWRGAQLLEMTGRHGVPVLIVGEEVVQGFDPLAIRRAFDRVAQGANST